MENSKLDVGNMPVTFLLPPTYCQETEDGLTEVWCSGPKKAHVYFMPGKDDIVIYE